MLWRAINIRLAFRSAYIDFVLLGTRYRAAMVNELDKSVPDGIDPPNRQLLSTWKYFVDEQLTERQRVNLLNQKH